MEFIDFKILFIIGHIFGVALGAGGAFMSDFMYMSSIKDEVLSKVELRFLKLGSIMTWLGVIILLTSGVLLFLTSPDTYLNSDKFLLKMIIVLIVVLNGIIFHFVHLPLLENTKERKMKQHKDFLKYGKFVYISGAISVISWSLAVILGSLRSIPISLISGILIYLFLLSIGILFSLLVFKKHVKNK